MITNRDLRRMTFHDQHSAIYAALVWAKLEDLIPCRWSAEDCEGGDTATMLQVVCMHQSAEQRVPFAMAMENLVDGFAPRGSTPYPDSAEALLSRRKATAKEVL
jgi:hypothetical protein